MSERLTAQEIENLRCSLIVLPRNVWSPSGYRVAVHMLHLHDTIQRLQTLQAKGVTPEELQAVNDEVSVLVVSSTIAAVCRGMLGEVGGDGNE